MAKVWDSLKKIIKDPQWLKQTEDAVIIDKIKEQLNEISLEQLGRWMPQQPPPVQSVSYALMPAKKAAFLFTQNSEAGQIDLIQKIAQTERIEMAALESLHQELEMLLAAESFKFSGKSGLNAVITMLQKADPEMRERIMDDLEEKNPVMHAKIKKELLKLEQLVHLLDADFAKICALCKDKTLVLLCAKTSQSIKDKILTNVSSNRKTHLLHEIECIGLVKKSDVEEATNFFVQNAEKMHEEGKIIFPWEDKMVFS